MTSLERLRGRERTVGLMGHVGDIRHPLYRDLEVLPPEADGRGSRILARGPPE